jgi:putative hemolysin
LSGIAARLLDFPSVVVKDVMTPMARVVLVAEGASETEVRRLVREHRFSRYPVFRDRPDNIVGVLHFRDMLQPCAGRYRRPLFVAPAARALAVMDRMKQEGEHFAMVREEGGPILGIVTLEDLLEELVGEIRSEE